MKKDTTLCPNETVCRAQAGIVASARLWEVASLKFLPQKPEFSQ